MSNQPPNLPEESSVERNENPAYILIEEEKADDPLWVNYHIKLYDGRADQAKKLIKELREKMLSRNDVVRFSITADMTNVEHTIRDRQELIEVIGLLNEFENDTHFLGFGLVGTSLNALAFVAEFFIKMYTGKKITEYVTRKTYEDVMSQLQKRYEMVRVAYKGEA